MCAVVDQQWAGGARRQCEIIGSVVKVFLVLLVGRHSMLQLRSYLHQTLQNPLDMVQLTPTQQQDHRSVRDAVLAEQSLIAKFIALENQAH